MGKLKQNTDLKHSDVVKGSDKQMDALIKVATDLRTDLEAIVSDLDRVVASFRRRKAA